MPRSKRMLRSLHVGVLAVALGAVGVPGAVLVGARAALAAPVARLDLPVVVAAAEALGALERGDRLGFLLARAEVAAAVASATETAVPELTGAWERAGEVRTSAILTALTQLGTPYRRNTSEPGVGFDCSGLTRFAWAVGAGVELPRSSERQAAAGRVVRRDDALAGDIVHYPGHVSLYLGVVGAALHAPYTGRSVEFNRSTARWVRYVSPMADEAVPDAG